MSDMNNRIREIFDQRRRKQNNWPRLIIMVIILIAIIVGISMLNKAAEKGGLFPGAVYQDSTAVKDSTYFDESMLLDGEVYRVNGADEAPAKSKPAETP